MTPTQGVRERRAMEGHTQLKSNRTCPMTELSNPGLGTLVSEHPCPLPIHPADTAKAMSGVSTY